MGLYEQYAAGLPIIDYHCHINPREIYEDRRFANLYEAWLEGDHYKWRAMRCAGVDEAYITGPASPREKFEKYAAVMPLLAGNPLYDWSHLELRRFLRLDIPLSAKTAGEVWAAAEGKLPSVREIIAMCRVEAIGTTDDPADSLEWHEKLADYPVTVFPTFRPDKAVNLDAAYLRAAGARSLGELEAWLIERLDYFAARGSRAADHALEYIPFRQGGNPAKTYARVMSGERPGTEDADAFKTHILLFLAREYKKRGMVMQLHFGARRNLNARMFAALGPDSGFDAIASADNSRALPLFLDALGGELPDILLYSLNPGDNAMLASVAGCFAPAVRCGAAWWFSDTLPGMEAHLVTLASLTPIGTFTGMLTDSRSFLSYTRHEYFRRLFCRLAEQWAAPEPEALIRAVCYENAKRLFRL